MRILKRMFTKQNISVDNNFIYIPNVLARCTKIFLIIILHLVTFSPSLNGQEDFYVSTIPDGLNFTKELIATVYHLSGTSSKIIFDGDTKTTYKVGPLSFNKISHLDFVIDEGVIVESLPGKFQNGHCVFKFFNSDFITISGVGKSSSINMLIDDYNDKGQQRHCISLNGCHNILIENLTLSESGGDGIYIGVNSKQYDCSEIGWRDCENISIKNIICDANARQGISIVSARNVTIDGCTFKNTGQRNEFDDDIYPATTGPYAGIDLEPNNECERLENINILNCNFTNNCGFTHPFFGDSEYLGFGILFAFLKLTENSPSVSINIDNCHISNDLNKINIYSSPYGIYFRASSNGLSGTIKITNCSITNTDKYSLVFQEWPHNNGNMNLTIDSLQIDNPTQDLEKAAVLIRNTGSDYYNGGFNIKNLEISNSISNKSILFDDQGKSSNQFKDIGILYTRENSSDIIEYPPNTDNVTIYRRSTSSKTDRFGQESCDSFQEIEGLKSDPYLADLNTNIYPGDYNGDGRTDLFIKGPEKYRALYYANTTGLSFSKAFSGFEDNVGGTDSENFLTHPDAKVYPGDYNGDGLTDLFIKGYEAYRVLYYGNAKKGGFSRAFMGQEDNIGGTDKEVFLTHPDAQVYPGDYNGDGQTDLFVKGFGTYQVLYIGNKEKQGFSRVFMNSKEGLVSTDSDLILSDQNSKVFPGDYNGDGKTDLFIIGSETYRALHYAIGTGRNISFSTAFSGYLKNMGGTEVEDFINYIDTKVYPADYNGDGLYDLFVGEVRSPYMIYIGSSDLMGFSRVTRNLDSNTEVIRKKSFSVSAVARIYPGDYNGDGFSEVLIVDSSSYYIFGLCEK